MKKIPYFYFIRTACIPLFLWFIFSACHQTPSAQKPEKLPDSLQRLAKNALKGLQIGEGLHATLFASEPMITNPTDMDIDSKGRIWICEGYNYRPKRNPGDPVHKEGDKILILEDTDGDGVADTSKVFYQGNDVNAALGICVLGNKVIVSCSPKVFIFTDTDGDDKADKKEILFEGISGHQHDHGIHAFTFGPDGKLYFNFGNFGDSLLDRNGNIVKDQDGIPINDHGRPYREGMAFRCDQNGENVEVLGFNFRNPYEIAVDSYGNLWQSDNDDDGNRGVRINFVMKYGNYGYTDEMDGANWRSYRVNMEDSIPYRHWHLNDPGVVPNLLQTGAGSPTGILVYEGKLLPDVFRNQVIHADALKNVIRSYPVKKNGAGYSAKIVNIVKGVYDKWFRPSDVCVAPDGSLFIADWYDPGVGGHQVGDLNRGRIYRIAPPGVNYSVSPPKLDNPEDAVKALENPNLATRYLAWKELHSWGDKAIPALEKMYASDNPRFQARALWLLSKIPGKGMQYIDQALKNKNEDIRITAIRAAKELKINIIPIIQKIVDDPSPQVRRTAIIALHHVHSKEAPALWAELAKQYNGKDRWYLEALGIGADKQWDSFFSAWLQLINDKWDTPAGRDIVWRARTKEALPLLAQIIEDPTIDPKENMRYFRALHFYADSDRERVLKNLLNGDHPQQHFINAMALSLMNPDNVSNISSFNKLVSQSLKAVVNRPEFLILVKKYDIKGRNPELMKMVLQAPSDEMRSDAMDLLLHSNGKKLVLRRLYQDNNDSAKIIIKVLGRNGSKVSKDVLQSLVLDPKYNTQLRKLATISLGRGRLGEDRLIELIDANLLPHEVDSIVSGILLHARRKDVRQKARAYFNISQDSESELSSIDQLVKLQGNVDKGRGVFGTFCTTCHQVNGKGTDFGPNLSEIGGKLAKKAIYKAIITPDAGISFGYEGYIFKLRSGKTWLGYVVNKADSETDIKVIGGKEIKMLNDDIVSKKSYNHSLMPTGLTNSMSQDQLVDLVAYLSSLKRKE